MNESCYTSAEGQATRSSEKRLTCSRKTKNGDTQMKELWHTSTKGHAVQLFYVSFGQKRPIKSRIYLCVYVYTYMNESCYTLAEGQAVRLSQKIPIRN